MVKSRKYIAHKLIAMAKQKQHTIGSKEFVLQLHTEHQLKQIRMEEVSTSIVNSSHRITCGINSFNT